jgi:NADP-reducing hydrogenase subunit HndB
MPIINSIDDLKRLREKAQKIKKLRDQSGKTQIVVGMGTVGIAAGARETVKAIHSYIKDNKLSDIILRQTDNFGLVDQDPVVKVIMPDQNEVTYAKVAPDVAKRIMQEYIGNGNVVLEYKISE